MAFNLHSIDNIHAIDGVEPPRRRADAVRRANSYRWRGAEVFLYYTGTDLAEAVLEAAHRAVEGHEEAVLRGEWRRSGVNSTPSPRRMPKNTKDAGQDLAAAAREGAGHAAVRPWCSYIAIAP